MGRGWEVAVGGVVLLLAGCSHSQLSGSTADVAKAVMGTQYRIALDNIAMLTDNPFALPWHVRMKTGTVQVRSEKELAEFSVKTGTVPGFGGPHSVRTVSEQWEAEAVTDPRTIKFLQDIYRAAVGLAPLPDPPYLEQGGKGTGANDGGGSPVPARDVPVGWFRTGTEEEVPEDAVFVGHYRERYAWVMRDGQERFGQFMLVVLAAVRPAPPGERGAGGQ